MTSSLADIVVAQKDVGYTSQRSTCPDGQFWLPVQGIQVVSGPRGNRIQLPFELLYYAPREPAVRVTDAPTLAYGVRLMLSTLRDDERDESWIQGRETTWETKRMVTSLIVKASCGDQDPHEIDELVAQWIARPAPSLDESKRAKWLSEVKEILIANPLLSLVQVARIVGVAPSYLSDQFSRAAGQTLSSFRRQAMLQRALNLAGKTTLNRAAIEAGFYDASHFHRVCQAELGVKPSELHRVIWPT